MTESPELQKFILSGALFIYKGDMMKIKKEYKLVISSTLKCYNLLLLHIDELKKQLAEVFINDGVSAVDYAGDGIKTNSINKLVENTALKNIEDVFKIKTEMSMAQSKLDRLDSAIGSLEMVDREIVILKCIKGYQWHEVSSEVKYSERMCKYKYSSCLSKLAYVFYGEKAFDLSAEAQEEISEISKSV